MKLTMMRIFLLAGILVLAGCASTSKTAKTDGSDRKVSIDPPGVKKGNLAANNARKATSGMLPEGPPQAVVVPVNGRVAKVNAELRFVVIDYMNSRQPRYEQKLSVYRVGQKVGEIKVSGPYLNNTVAADIVAGEAKYGDEVRTE